MQPNDAPPNKASSSESPEKEAQTQPPRNTQYIQPSEAFKQEVESNPDLTKTSTVVHPREIPPTTAVNTLQEESSFSPAQNYPVANNGSKKKLIFIIIALLGITLLVAGLLLYRNKNVNTAGTAETQPPTEQPSSPTAFEKKLSSNPQYLEKVKSFSLPIYVPKDKNIGAAIIGSTKINGENFEYVQYGINSQNGRGLVPGAYSVGNFSQLSYFNPPNDCGLPGGRAASTPIACIAYDGADKDMPAWSYKGQQPGGINNTNVSPTSYLTLYVKKGREIITIQTAGSSPAELYKMVKDMVVINPLDLPESSLVDFR